MEVAWADQIFIELSSLWIKYKAHLLFERPNLWSTGKRKRILYREFWTFASTARSWVSMLLRSLPNTEVQFLRHFRSFSRKHGPVSLEGSTNSNLYEIRRRVSTSFPTNFHAFSISFRTVNRSSFLLLIQISSPRRNNKVFASVIYKPLYHMSRY